MKYVSKAICFLLIFFLFFTWLDNRFYDCNNFWEVTDDWSGQQFDIVFMGNSHVFWNINPVIVNDALHINTIILASASQPSEITYYNLKELLKKTTPKALVIEANILNSSVDFLYETNREGLLYKNFDGIRNPFTRAWMVCRLIPVDKWFEAYSSLFRPLETWSRFQNLSMDNRKDLLLGYRVKTGVLEDPVDLARTEQRYKESAGSRQGTEEKIDMSWLEKTLALAQEKEIPVLLIKSPITAYSDANSDMMYDLSALAENYPVVSSVHDYDLDLSAIGLTREDYHDNGHLNYLGAVKFTEYLTRDLGRWLGISPDFSGVGWLRGEHEESLSDGMCRCTVDLYDGCLIRFITSGASQDAASSAEFSRDNSIVIPAGSKLSFEIKAINPDSYTFDHPQRIKFIRKASLPEDPEKTGIARDLKKTDIEIVQDGSTLTLTNHFDESPVQYAWYVYKGNEPILKQGYTVENSNSFSYEFTEAGSYKIRAFIRSMDKADIRSIDAVRVTVDRAGLSWK